MATSAGPIQMGVVTRSEDHWMARKTFFPRSFSICLVGTQKSNHHETFLISKARDVLIWLSSRTARYTTPAPHTPTNETGGDATYGGKGGHARQAKGKRGQDLVQDRQVSENSELFASIFEVGRRYKIMNPDKMRSHFGKLLWR